MFTEKINQTKFLRLCFSGNLAEVKNALAHGEDPSADQNAAIYTASSQGHVSVVALLLLDNRVNPADRNNASVIVALLRGHNSLVDCLVKDGRIDCSIPENVRKFGNCSLQEVQNAIVEKANVTSGNHLVVYNTLRNRHYDAIQFLLEQSLISPACLDNIIIKTILGASRLKKEELELLEILLQPKNVALGVDPAAMDNRAMILAMKNKYVELFRQLLKPENVTKGVDINTIIEVKKIQITPLCFAVEQGFIDVVRQLLQCENINLRIGNPLVCAIRSRSMEMFYLLLNDKRINPAENYNEAICEASALGATEVVRVLLSDARVNPHPKLPVPDSDIGAPRYIHVPSNNNDDSDDSEKETKWFYDKRTKKYVDFHHNLPICSAAKNNHTDVVVLLLQDNRVEPDTVAPSYMKEWLESDERSSPESFDNLPVIDSIENDNLNIFIQLIAFKNVKEKLLHDPQLIYHLTKAFEKKRFSIIEYILNNNEFFEEILARLTDESSYGGSNDTAEWFMCPAAKVGFLLIFEKLFQNKIVQKNLKESDIWYVAIRFGHLEIANKLSENSSILKVGVRALGDDISRAIIGSSKSESHEGYQCFIKNLTQPMLNYLLQIEKIQRLFKTHGVKVCQSLLQAGNIPAARFLYTFLADNKIVIPESLKEKKCYRLVELRELTYLCAWEIAKNNSINIATLPPELSEPIQEYRTNFNTQRTLN